MRIPKYEIVEHPTHHLIVEIIGEKKFPIKVCYNYEDALKYVEMLDSMNVTFTNVTKTEE